MKKAVISIIGLMLIFGLVVNIAQADTMTYSYNYIIAGPDGLPVNLGTLTLTDNGNMVKFNLILANSSWKVLELAFNFNDAKFNNFSDLKILSDSLSIAQNNTKVDGYYGMFDMKIPSNGNIGTFGSYSGSIAWNGGASDLNISDFNFTDTSGMFYSAVHIGSLADGKSVWAGGTTSVPEPGTLVLLGFGLIGAADFGRKFRVNR